MFQTSLKPLTIVLLVLSVYTLGGLDAIRAGAEHIPSAPEEGKGPVKERPDLSRTQFRPQIRPDLSGTQFQPEVKRGVNKPAADAKIGPSTLEVCALRGHSAAVYFAAFSPNGETLVTAA